MLCGCSCIRINHIWLTYIFFSRLFRIYSLNVDVTYALTLHVLTTSLGSKVQKCLKSRLFSFSIPELTNQVQFVVMNECVGVYKF